MPRLYSFLFLLVLFTLLPTAAAAQTAPEYRALWVETFNTPLGTRADIDKVIAAAVDGNLNAIFAQVRRRGDSWYLDTLEPLTQVTGVGEPDASGAWTFDPLQYLIDQAHLRQIEVHAYVIVGAIYNSHPTLTGVPKDPNHVFNTHVWNKGAAAVYPVGDPRQWATRGLPHSTFIAAGNPNPVVTTFDGQRFAAEWYVDLGHPDASAYTVDVLTHLVRKYAIDGLHLDRIRYPEAPIDKPSAALATWGINVGYNETSVNRFKTRYGTAATYYTSADLGTNVNPAATGGAPPAIIGSGDLNYPRTNDALWNSWRREQVTNFVRRLYLNATAANPRIKLSAATICFWTGPVGSGSWERTEAYYRVFQDWRAWMQEGTLDIAAPMIYKREHNSTERGQYEDWLSFTKTLAQSSGRQGIAGLGAYINGVEGSLRQARKALARAPFDTGYAPGDGVIVYALGSTVANTLVNNSTSAAVTANPFSLPLPNVSTPKRTNAQFFSAVRTGAAGTTQFEDPGFGPLFASTAPVPDMPWKSSPTLGHVMGFAKDGTTPLDGAFVTIHSLTDPAVPPRLLRTDGGGFYGAVGLAPGAYKAAIELGAVRLDVCRFDVTAGLVTTASEATADAVAPVTSGSVTGPVGENQWYTGDAVVTLVASDDCSGVSFTEYSTDGGTTWIRYAGPVTISAEGSTAVSYRSVDAAGNVETSSTIALKIDKTAPVLTLSADRVAIWPPNGNLEPIALTGTASDAASGLVGVTYTVVDEYGGTFAIDPRTLSGASAAWTDAVALEARRDGFDLDGRLYRIVATVRDAAGHTASAPVQVVVLHDRR